MAKVSKEATRREFAYRAQAAAAPSKSSHKLYHGMDLCAICGFEGRGFGFQLDFTTTQQLPHYEFCSMICLDGGYKLADKGVIPKLTDMERQAMLDARLPLAIALEEIGLMPVFEGLTKEQIMAIIEATVSGFRGSMQRQSNQGIIPF